MGATILARQVGCAQSLVSGLERNNAKGSEHNNKFASALGVEPGWLATGTGRTPEGFDEDEARKMLHVGGGQLLSIVHGSPAAHGRQGAVAPRLVKATEPPIEAGSDAATLQRLLMEYYIKFVALVGVTRAQAVLDLMHSYTEALRQGTTRQNQS